MRGTLNRRTATKVKDGRVQRKNRHRPTDHDRLVLARESPGRGFRHVVSKRDVQAFIDIIPGWPGYSERLDRIILGRFDGDADGWHCFHFGQETGAIILNAWPDELVMATDHYYFAEHEQLLERLGVSLLRSKKGVICTFNEAQARAFMLLHVFMHELGHHVDRAQQKHHGSSKGEDYAERFANDRLEQIWPEYIRVFGHPAKNV